MSREDADMRAQENNPSFFRQWLRPLLMGTAVGIIACVAVLMLMAALVQTVDVPRAAVVPLAITAGAVGAFAAGLTAALVSRRRGMVLGALCGLTLFLLVLLAGFARYTGVSGGMSLLKAAVLTVAGALGGVLGVNKKH